MTTVSEDPHHHEHPTPITHHAEKKSTTAPAPSENSNNEKTGEKKTTRKTAEKKQRGKTAHGARSQCKKHPLCVRLFGPDSGTLALTRMWRGHVGRMGGVR